MRTYNRLLEPISRAGEEIEEYFIERPKRRVGGVILLALLVGLGIWAWPELHRTIHIHRM